VLISFIGWIYAGRVLQPISNIVDEVSKISETNLNRRVEEGNKNDELGRLAQTFNKMLDRLEDAFTAQKHFISNASHEIKTPITVMRGQIDVALLQDRDRPYYISVLESLAKILKGLNELSSRLLMLAHSTASITDRVFSPIRIDDVIWETKVELLNAHGEYNVDVMLDKELADKPLTIAGDEQLLKVAILNLLDNGCKYSPNHTVCVSLSYEDDNCLSLSFVNTGLPISTGDLQRIFEPFFRSAGNSSSKGFGIGLSLTASIVKLHGGVISVSSTQDSTEFVVKLPAK
jgi:signal transduction histidine kinase